LTAKEIIMAKKEKLIVSSARGSAAALESVAMRALRIDGSCNGTTLRTRVIKNKKLYNRNLKHKKSFADAGDFPISMGAACSPITSKKFLIMFDNFLIGFDIKDV